MALSCRTFSLAHLLIYYAFRAVICIAYGDPDGGDEDGRNGARSAVKRRRRTNNSRPPAEQATSAPPRPIPLRD